MKKIKIYLDTNVIGFLDEPTNPREIIKNIRSCIMNMRELKEIRKERTKTKISANRK